MEKRFRQLQHCAVLILAQIFIVDLRGEAPQPPEADVSFAQELYPIIRRKCAACHAAGENGNLAIGQSAAEYYTALTTQTAKTPCDPPMASDGMTILRLDPLTAPKDPDSSFFLTKLTTDRCGKKMAAQALLNAKEIELFRRWIQQGAKNN